MVRLPWKLLEAVAGSRIPGLGRRGWGMGDGGWGGRWGGGVKPAGTIWYIQAWEARPSGGQTCLSRGGASGARGPSGRAQVLESKGQGDSECAAPRLLPGSQCGLGGVGWGVDRVGWGSEGMGGGAQGQRGGGGAGDPLGRW